MPNRNNILGVLTTFALIALASPAVASEWRYGCRSVLLSGDAPVIIFNRSSLIMLSKAWVNGLLIASLLLIGVGRKWWPADGQGDRANMIHFVIVNSLAWGSYVSRAEAVEAY